jgi:hypothetical protein
VATTHYLTEDELREFQNYLLDTPDAGDVITGTGGIREQIGTVLFSTRRKQNRPHLFRTVILWEMKCQDNVFCMLTFTDYAETEKVLISHNVPAIESCDYITPEAPEIHSIFHFVINKKR